MDSNNNLKFYVTDQGTIGSFYSSSTDAINFTGRANILLGDRSIAMGSQAGRNSNSDTPDDQKIIIGYQAGAYATGSNNSIMMGYQGGYQSSGSENIYLGDLSANWVKGSNNIGIGYKALEGSFFDNAEMSFATSIGVQSAASAESADYTTTLGYRSGFNISGSGNTYLGNETGKNTKGVNNVAIGYDAMDSTSQNSNNLSNTVAIGYEAYLEPSDNTTQGNGVFIGTEAGKNMTGAAYQAVAIGWTAAEEADAVSGLIAIGAGAAKRNKGIAEQTLGVYIGTNAGFLLSNNGTRHSNVFIGSSAGQYVATGSSGNVLIGHSVGLSSSDILDGNTIIGANLYKSQATGAMINNTVMIGSDEAVRLQVSSSGKFQFHSYGAGTFDETNESTTLTKQLGVDANGHVIETGVTYMNSASVSFTSGTGTFTVSPNPTYIVLTLQTTTPGEILTYNGVSGAGLVTANLKTDGGTLVTGTRTVHYMYKV